MIRQRTGRSAEALSDYRYLADHPNIDVFLDREHTGLMTYVILSADEIRRGEPEEAIRLAERASQLAARYSSYVGEAHYARARAYAAAASVDPSRLQLAADALGEAHRMNEAFLTKRFVADPLFAPHRAELTELIEALIL